jgi:nickel/cobalt transporter (NiCoT) family protein
MRRPVTLLCAVLAGFNVAAWIAALVVFRAHPVLLGTALVAYSLGLRHAVDADHIAAIDNVTRKLMQEGKRPVGVGLFFAMGHSTVVILAAAGVAGVASVLAGSFDRFKSVGSVIGTGISASFLFVIATVNLIILRGVWRTFQHVRKGGHYVEEDFDLLLNSRGLLSRWLSPLFRLISESWHMYPLGFLFGLGFDTATEVAVLAASAAAAVNGVSIWAIMVFPALFAAGISLIDTSDGILMLGAYNWAIIKPMRKLYYNLTITFVSVVIAVLIGGIETLGLMGDQFALKGAFWGGVGALNDNFTALGFAVIGLFIMAWVGSVIFYRYNGLDEVQITCAER